MGEDGGYIRGYGTRLQQASGYYLGTFAETMEVMALALATGPVAMALLPRPAPGVDGGTEEFLSASGLGVAAGLLYVVYRLVLRAAFGRSLVVAIPRNPNVDWYLSLRAFGIAMGGVIGGIYLLSHGLSGDPMLRSGPNAPFVSATVATVAVGMLYLGAMKLAVFFLGPRATGG
jgi:hypothetical protein